MTDQPAPGSARRAVDRLEPLARRLSRRYRRLEAIAPTPVAEAPVSPEYFAEVCRFHGDAMRLAREGVRCGLRMRLRRPGDLLEQTDPAVDEPDG